MSELAAEWIKIPDGNGNLQKVWVRDSTARRDIAQLQTDVSGKADAATTLAGYGITDAYTKTQVDGMIPSVPSAYTSNPEMDGTASPGSSTAWAKGDHVHPSDTSKQDALTSAQLAAVDSGITNTLVTALGTIHTVTGTTNSNGDILLYSDTNTHVIAAWGPYLCLPFVYNNKTYVRNVKVSSAGTTYTSMANTSVTVNYIAI